MISIERSDCCGCSACVQACPKKCIIMEGDEEGFLLPGVEESLCVNCRLCEKVCPISHKAQNNRNNIIKPIEVYVAYTPHDEIRMRSSSGGVFTLLANNVLLQNGIVFGAAFDADFQVHHIGIETEEELQKLQGSKYLQSRIENTYSEVKAALDAGRKVLFSGTACQIAGLKGYLRGDYENLLTVDVLCHGVPSPKVWKKYLEEQEKTHGAAVRRMFFRHKKYGWKTFTIILEFSNNVAYERIFNQDTFMRLFLSNICLRPSCHKCRFKEINRPSDITLGDCWGVDVHSAEMDDNKGTSVVLVHSAKGEDEFDIIKPDLNYKEVELDTVLPPEADSRKSVVPHPKREEFFKKLDDSGVLKSVKLLNPSFLTRACLKIKNCTKHMF